MKHLGIPVETFPAIQEEGSPVWPPPSTPNTTRGRQRESEEIIPALSEDENESDAEPLVVKSKLVPYAPVRKILHSLKHLPIKLNK